MEISVEKIASLAYLKLSEQEQKDFQKKFNDVLHYVDKLQEVPMSPDEAKEMGAYHVLTAFYKELGLDPADSLRDENNSEEVEKLNLKNEEALKNSPRSGGLPGELLYEVPSIIER